jgi:hypothetical protein
MPDGQKLEPHHRNLASAIDQMNCGLIEGVRSLGDPKS